MQTDSQWNLYSINHFFNILIQIVHDYTCPIQLKKLRSKDILLIIISVTEYDKNGAPYIEHMVKCKHDLCIIASIRIVDSIATGD